MTKRPANIRWAIIAVAEVSDIVGHYRAPPSTAVVLCVDDAPTCFRSLIGGPTETLCLGNAALRETDQWLIAMR